MYMWLLCAEKPYHEGTLPMAVLTTLFLYCTFSRWILFCVPVVVSFRWNTEAQLWLLDYWTLGRGFFFLENNLELKKRISQSKHEEMRNSVAGCLCLPFFPFSLKEKINISKNTYLANEKI